LNSGQRLLLVAACALIDAQNRVLVARRPEGKSLAGLWEFPGGKIERGESPEHAIIRELREELGVTTEFSNLLPLTFASHTYPDFHLLMPLFVCREWNGLPSPVEGQKIAWVQVSELLRQDSHFPMPPADVPLLPMLRHYLELGRTDG
jgi:8-oxo-dGTP diphosphatase